MIRRVDSDSDHWVVTVVTTTVPVRRDRPGTRTVTVTAKAEHHVAQLRYISDSRACWRQSESRY
jgi:hypothetical protein